MTHFTPQMQKLKFGNRDFYILGNCFEERSIRSPSCTDHSADNALCCRLAAAVRAAMLGLFKGPCHSLSKSVPTLGHSPEGQVLTRGAIPERSTSADGSFGEVLTSWSISRMHNLH